MARLAGVDIPREKRIVIALTYIFGVGQTRSEQTLAATGVDPNTRVKDLSDEQLVGLRDYIEESLTRGSRYLPMIQSVFRAEGLPLDLAYVPLIESAFKPNALSRAKAKGVWQFMRGTAIENGIDGVSSSEYSSTRSLPDSSTDGRDTKA